MHSLSFWALVHHTATQPLSLSAVLRLPGGDRCLARRRYSIDLESFVAIVSQEVRRDSEVAKLRAIFLEMSDGKESVGSADNAKQETSHVNAIHTKLEELSINIAAKRKEKLEGNINDQTKTTEYSFAANSSPLRTVVAGKGASFKAVMASTLRKKAEKTRMCCTKGHEVIKLSYKNNYDRCALCKKSGVLYHCEKMYSSRWNSPCRR